MNKKDNGYYIFVKYFTRDGKKYFAEDYGKKAFKIWIKG